MNTSKHSYRDPDRRDWIKGIVSITLYLVILTVTAFWLLVDYWYIWLIIVLGGLAILINWHTRNYAYRCRNCEHEFEISFFANLIAPHGIDKAGSWTWLKCPDCHKRNKATVIRIEKL